MFDRLRRAAIVEQMSERMREMPEDVASAVVRNLPDSPSVSPDREPMIETMSEYRGNRLTHRFYPMHHARVLLARDNARRYGGLS